MFNALPADVSLIFCTRTILSFEFSTYVKKGNNGGARPGAGKPSRCPLPVRRTGQKSFGILQVIRVAESKPFTHELELLVALPHQLVARWWVVFATQVSTNASNQSHRFRKR